MAKSLSIKYTVWFLKKFVSYYEQYVLRVLWTATALQMWFTNQKPKAEQNLKTKIKNTTANQKTKQKWKEMANYQMKVFFKEDFALCKFFSKLAQLMFISFCNNLFFLQLTLIEATEKLKCNKSNFCQI